MSRIASTEHDLEVDLEMGLNVRPDDRNKEAVNLSSNVQGSSKVAADPLKAGGEKTVDEVEKKAVKDKHKKGSNRKHPKPPRPPRSPSLDAVDPKLIKEIAELAMLKRARIERMKALKKKKAAGSSSSSNNNNTIATVFTIMFFLLFIFHSMPCSLKHGNSQGSPTSSTMIKGGPVSAQYFGHPSSSFSGPGYIFPNSVNPVSWSKFSRKSLRNYKMSW